jgi:hypothetical protein
LLEEWVARPAGPTPFCLTLSPLVLLGVGLVVGFGFGLVVGFGFGLVVGFGVGLVVGFGVELVVGFGFGLVVGFGFGLVVGFGFGLVVGFGFGLRVFSRTVRRVPLDQFSHEAPARAGRYSPGRNQSGPDGQRLPRRKALLLGRYVAQRGLYGCSSDATYVNGHRATSLSTHVASTFAGTRPVQPITTTGLDEPAFSWASSGSIPPVAAVGAG